MNTEISPPSPAVPPGQPPPLPRPRRCWLPWTVAVVAVVALIVVAGQRRVAELAGAPAARWIGQRGGEDEFPRLRERWSYGSGTTKVACIRLDGPIFRGSVGFFAGGDLVESVLRQIRAASNDEHVRAILLDVSSPGGAVTPCDEIHAALRRFRESREDRRVVALVRDLAASGGYYVAVAADRIVAQPTAIVGSIGVLFESLNWHELARKLGVDAAVVKSGENKDLMNPFRPVDTNHLEILKRIVDDCHRRFCELVAKGRNLPVEEVRSLADGTVFTAADARARRMVDEIGFWEEAVAATARELGVETVRVIRYEDRPLFLRELFGATVGPAARRLGPQLLMLWAP
ncbi:MAG: signal peptide peptidase SppA [Kiritimatiellae bacterium]|nr:signal peptide peptidase SppA [Kiritimatiellia bacterium]